MPIVDTLHYVVHALTIIVLSIAFVLSKFSALFFPKTLTNILKYAIFIYALTLFINIVGYNVYTSKYYNYILAYHSNTGIQILKCFIKFCVFDVLNISLLVIVWILAIPDYIQEQAKEPIDMTFDELNL